MAFDFQKPYGPDIEQLLRQYYQSLSEKDRRRFAASKRSAWGMEARGTSLRCWNAIRTLFTKACGN